MPFIQIHLVKGKSAQYIKAVADGIHQALIGAWGIPENDHFQIITEHKKEHFHFDKTIWGISRSDNVIAIYITSIQRTQVQKKKLYRELAQVLSCHPKIKARKEDIFVTIVQVEREDWSFGNGLAQLITPSAKP